MDVSDAEGGNGQLPESAEFNVERDGGRLLGVTIEKRPSSSGGTHKFTSGNGVVGRKTLSQATSYMDLFGEATVMWCAR